MVSAKRVLVLLFFLVVAALRFTLTEKRVSRPPNDLRWKVVGPRLEDEEEPDEECWFCGVFAWPRLFIKSGLKPPVANVEEEEEEEEEEGLRLARFEGTGRCLKKLVDSFDWRA
jgi:hypothetical protein